MSEHEDSERPVAASPRSTSPSDPKDPLWKSVGDLTAEVAKIIPRLEAAEELAKDAHAIASDARSKVDVLALAQVQSQKDFTLAIQAQTTALKTFGTGLEDVKAIGRWLLVLIVIMSLGTFATLVIMLTRH
jgi:hypothetical protein